jgi:hypothetical protein
MGLRCDKECQEFGSEVALSMHLKDKHGITSDTEISKAIAQANSTPHKLLVIIKSRKRLICGLFAVIVIILSISFIISQYSTPDLGGMSASMRSIMNGGMNGGL